jgi:hypothetical protein
MPSWPCAVSVRLNITPLRLSQEPINADEVFGTHTIQYVRRDAGKPSSWLKFANSSRGRLGRTAHVTWTACLLAAVYDVGYLIQMGVDLVR